MSEPVKARTGGCLCGRVKYKLEGEAATPMWTTVCHCLNCRRMTGSALYTASICPLNVCATFFERLGLNCTDSWRYRVAIHVHADALHTRCTTCRHIDADASLQGFTITEGEDVLTTYVDNLTDSGQPLKRQFCKICGSSMFNFTPLYDIVSISAGSHDDFEDWKPTLEQYCIHRADFVEKAKGAEKRYVESITGDLEKD